MYTDCRYVMKKGLLCLVGMILFLSFLLLPSSARPQCTIGDPTQVADIKIDTAGLFSGKSPVTGTVNNINSNEKVVVWIKTDIWYRQQDPAVDCDCLDGSCGSWSVPIWQNPDYPWISVVAMVVPDGYEYAPGAPLWSHPAETDGVIDWEEFPGPIGDPKAQPEIQIIDVEGNNKVTGKANNIEASKFHVVLWLKTDIWYVQPSIGLYETYVSSNGSWYNTVYGYKPGWNKIVALLVDENEYAIGNGLRWQHPSSDTGVAAWDEFPRTIAFSGYQWDIKDGYWGPGPNDFSGSNSNVWVDDNGLHLKITKSNDMWYCAEVYSLKSFGYGMYTYRLSTRVDNLDPRAVFGAFIYDWDSQDEIDLEFSKDMADPVYGQYNALYSLHVPKEAFSQTTRFVMSDTATSTHQIIWEPGKITYKIRDDRDGTEILNGEYHKDILPKDNRMRFNLWLLQGLPPVNGVGDEVIIKSFNFSSL